jgi:hypothetical protein
MGANMLLTSLFTLSLSLSRAAQVQGTHQANLGTLHHLPASILHKRVTKMTRALVKSLLINRLNES